MGWRDHIVCVIMVHCVRKPVYDSPLNGPFLIFTIFLYFQICFETDYSNLICEYQFFSQFIISFLLELISKRCSFSNVKLKKEMQSNIFTGSLVFLFPVLVMQTKAFHKTSFYTFSAFQTKNFTEHRTGKP